MPIYHSIWKVGETIKLVHETVLKPESSLEDILQKNIEILNKNWLIIGRQVPTKFKTFIDLIAIDQNESLIIIELKKEKTPRDVTAQAIDYASWVEKISFVDILEIFEKFKHKYLKVETKLEDEFFKKFNTKLKEEECNKSHQIVIVATELDLSTERMINYLSDKDIPINVLIFKVFEDNDVKYISRAWQVDPFETEDNATKIEPERPWNGEFYVSFAETDERNWDDARELGFVSAGGGEWYSRTLNLLEIGKRVWINIPGKGYVGVGIVIDTVKRADEVIFEKNGKKGNIYKFSKRANYFKENLKKNTDEAEYIVKIKWKKTVSSDSAISELGFFGNQNIVCQPKAQKWTFTVDRLKEIWKIS